MPVHTDEENLTNPERVPCPIILCPLANVRVDFPLTCDAESLYNACFCMRKFPQVVHQ